MWILWVMITGGLGVLALKQGQRNLAHAFLWILVGLTLMQVYKYFLTGLPVIYFAYSLTWVLVGCAIQRYKRPATLLVLSGLTYLGGYWFSASMLFLAPMFVVADVFGVLALLLLGGKAIVRLVGDCIDYWHDRRLGHLHAPSNLAREKDEKTC